MPYVPYHTHEFDIPTATQAEIEAGVRDDVAITPDQLKPVLDAITAGGVVPPVYREVTAAGDITADVSDDIIGVNKTAGEATNVNLGPAADRAGKILIIKDVKGDADANPITPVADGAELIDGLAASDWAIVSPRDSLKLLPVSGGWITVP